MIDPELARAAELVGRRLGGMLSAEEITVVLAAASAEFDTNFDPTSVLCLDCQAHAIAACERDGHGLVTLDDLIENYR